MTAHARDDLTAALDAIADPASGRGLVAAGRAAPPRQGPDGRVSVILDVAGIATADRGPLESRIVAALQALPGVSGARVLMTAERSGPKLIAVGSGKGGVGKSTLAANLAVALARGGAKVGLVDADIYGPSQPRLMAAEGERPVAAAKQLHPIATRWGVPMLSIGQLVDPGKAIAWRGPMVAGALGQLLEADWNDAELLVVDLPPGTGDIQLSLIQKHRPAGALIISTPQDLALIDATRAIDLFVQAHVPILGLVENMAGYACPHCGAVSDPFGIGGAEAAAKALGIAFLGRIPLDVEIRRASDAGEPPAAGSGAPAEAFGAIAAAVLAALEPSRAPKV